MGRKALCGKRTKSQRDGGLSGPTNHFLSLSFFYGEPSCRTDCHETLSLAAAIRFELISALLLAVAWIGLPRPAAAELPLKYLPDGSNMLISARFQEVFDSTYYQNLKKELADFSKGEESFEIETGITPSNLGRVTLAGNIAGKGDEGQPTIVFQTRNAVTADDVRQKMKPRSYQKDFKIDEVKVGEYTIYDPTFHYAFAQTPSTMHGQAFVVVESNVVVESRNVEGLRKILQRGRTAELTATMQSALKDADEAKTLLYAIDLKAITADEQFTKDMQRQFGPLFGGAGNVEMLKRLESLSLDGNLSGDDAVLRATLVCNDAVTAADAKKMAEGCQAVLRQVVQVMPRAPREIADSINAIKFTVDGSKLQAAGQVKVDPAVAWVRAEYENARKQAVERAQRAAKQAEELQRRLNEVRPQGGQR